MSDDTRARADQNLADAAARLGLADPRPPYRERLRALKEENAEAFAKALRHYEETVLPAVAGGKDVMEAWIQYGVTIAALSSPGRLVSVDATGRANRYMPPVSEGALILHLPDNNASAAMIAAAPVAPTPAQQATLDLLVNGRLS
jgi:hypothetical protein